MRRCYAAIIALLLILLCCPCFAAAEKDFYCEYTPKTTTGSLFYIDVYCEREVSGAVFELSYEPDKAEFRSADAIASTSSCRSKAENGTVKTVIADNAAVSSHICRLSFKALKTGELTFRLRMTQACDKNLNMLDNWNDDTLTITLGKDDIPDPDQDESGASKTKSSSSASSKGRSGKSSISQDSDDDAPNLGGVFDLRKMNPWGYILFGVGLVLLIAGLIYLGIKLERRRANKHQPEQKENLPATREVNKAEAETSDPSEEAPADEIE